MAFNKEQPYNDLPLLPPNNLVWEDIEVYKKLTDARAALAELKGRSPVIPNPMMLINTLVLQEAKDSSSIENIFTSSDKLYRAFASSTTKPDAHTKEVLRYRQALLTAWETVKEEAWSIELMESIYRNIKNKEDGVRDEEVYIGSRFATVYTPPCCKDVLMDKLSNWVGVASGFQDIDPLIRMALLHYQFESIHPFFDGNGRTGRILNVLYISKYGLLDEPILYLSKYINENKADYYRLLLEVTENINWKEWLLYILTAVEETAKFTLQKVNAIYSLFQATIEKVKTEANTIYSHELIEIIFNQPYCKIGFLVDAGIASRNTASKYLLQLVEIGVLEKEQVGNELLYLNTKLFKILSKA